MTEATVTPAFSFKVKKHVTLPLFKWENNTPYYYRFDGPIAQGKPIKEKAGESKKEPAFLASVTNLATGEQGEIILGTVLRGILEDDYPEAAYVGKCFELVQKRITGKNYNSYGVTEIEVDSAATESAPTSKKK
ncbi:MAG: hypothetical protein ACYC3F_17200 [Gemmatimonadaceae bacterium]